NKPPCQSGRAVVLFLVFLFAGWGAEEPSENGDCNATSQHYPFYPNRGRKTSEEGFSRNYTQKACSNKHRTQ
ncbi:hypothetical protein, partial [Paucidesulfovibrio gracilis]|uniref:hypothetical protein n=1 Tax=Paucidesulfovibrio gracilis TaxID=47158 RepID=UPI001F231B6B